LKRNKSGRLSELQKRFLDKMSKLGMTDTAVLYGKDQVDEWVDKVAWEMGLQ